MNPNCVSNMMQFYIGEDKPSPIIKEETNERIKRYGIKGSFTFKRTFPTKLIGSFELHINAQNIREAKALMNSCCHNAKIKTWQVHTDPLRFLGDILFTTPDDEWFLGPFVIDFSKNHIESIVDGDNRIKLCNQRSLFISGWNFYECDKYES